MKMIQRYKKTFAMSAAALGLLAGLTVDSSMAYFTTYVSAGGSQVINLDAETEIHEDVSDLTKHITLGNLSSRGDCFVRVKVFYGDQIQVDIYNPDQEDSDKNHYEVTAADNWYQGDETDAYGYEYWYYRPVLGVGEMTTGLDVKIDVTGLLKPGYTDPDDLTSEWVKDKFNVVVVQECTPVTYDADGNATADWNTTYTDFVEVNDGEEAGN